MPSGYRPSAYLEIPSQFGVDADATWFADKVPRSQLDAAQLQHLIAVELRRSHGDGAPRIVAGRLASVASVDYVRRKLNGQTPLTLTDLTAVRINFPTEFAAALDHWMAP